MQDAHRLDGLVVEFQHWMAFQLAYQHAKGEGMDDGASHDWACYHESEFLAEVVALCHPEVNS